MQSFNLKQAGRECCFAGDADNFFLTGVHAEQFTALPCQLQVGASRGG